MENAKSLRFAGTSAIRQIRFTLGFSDNDNHRARWRGAAAYIPPLVTRDPATPGACGPGTPKLQPTAGGRPGTPQTPVIYQEPRRPGSPVRTGRWVRKSGNGARTPRNDKTAALACPRQCTAAARPRRDQIGNVRKRNAGNTPASGERGRRRTRQDQIPL